MRIQRLQVPAYGPFTDFQIELAKGESDFHILHGPNEAGKSSLLRAIRGLLFGIPERTPDNFRHENSRLRIAAELERVDGSTRYVQRRKGRKDTLLDADNQPLSAGELARYLGVVDEGYFDSLFGLDGEKLREGANELLRGHGKLGEALFSASLGGTPVDRVLAGLQAEAGELFSGRARKSIRVACTAIQEHRKKAKEALLKPDEVEQVEREIERLRKELEMLKGEKATKASRKAWLESCQGALPVVGQLSDLRDKLGSLPELPALPASFADEIRDARAVWRRAAERVSELEARLGTLEEKRSRCEVNAGILEHRAEIEAIQGETGAYRQDRKDLASKTAEADQLKVRIEARCAELEIEGTPDDLEAYRISDPGFLAAKQAAEHHARAVSDVTAARERQRLLEVEIADLKARAATPEDASRREVLSAAVQQAAELETRANTFGARRERATELHGKLGGLHRELSGAPADFAQLCSLSVPLRATIERFREDAAEVKRQREELEADLAAKRAEIRKLKADMDRLVRQRELPTLDDLKRVRTERDDAWKRVVEDWRGSAESGGGEALEQEYPEKVVRADEIADRLRLEADTVAQFEEKKLQHEQAEEEQREIEADLERAIASETELSERWGEAWSGCGLVPLSPKEMLEWRDRWADFVQTWSEWSNIEQGIAKDEKEIQAGSALLSKTLDSDESEFLVLLKRAKIEVERLTMAAGAAEESARLLSAKEMSNEELTAEVSTLETAAADALTRWQQVAVERRLPAALDPANAIEILRSRRELIRERDRWQELEAEGERLVQRVNAFEERVGRLVTKLALLPGDADVSAGALRQELQKATTQQERREGLDEEIEHVEGELADSKVAVGTARDDFEGLLKRGSIPSDEALDGFLATFEERIACQSRIGDLEQVLAGIARGTPLDDFVAKVMAEDALTLAGEMVSLGDELAAADDRLEAIRGDLQREEGKRSMFERANDEAASESQLADHAAAQAVRDAERFVRLQLAVSILRSRIDRFREQNQGPFLERASSWFRQITGGSFSGITTSYDAGDQPVIAGVRAGESSVHGVMVDAMSEGTRDQLYLALRFAGLELHRQEHEPVPMVLDDLLVHFDDGRSAHALSALSQLGRGSQVLLFTHHAHLVELARQTLGASGFHLTELSSAAG
jgi:uncharacterized protein YhaN